MRNTQRPSWWGPIGWDDGGGVGRVGIIGIGGLSGVDGDYVFWCRLMVVHDWNRWRGYVRWCHAKSGQHRCITYYTVYQRRYQRRCHGGRGGGIGCGHGHIIWIALLQLLKRSGIGYYYHMCVQCTRRCTLYAVHYAKYTSTGNLVLRNLHQVIIIIVCVCEWIDGSGG